MKKTTVVIGFAGSDRDKRNHPWRPTLSLFSAKNKEGEKLDIARFELLYDESQKGKFFPLVDELKEDIAAVSPKTEVFQRAVDFKNRPFHTDTVFAALWKFFGEYEFKPEKEDYFIHLATGTNTVLTCLFIASHSRAFPCRLLQSWREHEGEDGAGWEELKPDISKYARLATPPKTQQSDDEILKGSIKTRNKEYNDTIKEIERVALKSIAPVLLLGPTGSGKTSLAKRIFECRQRKTPAIKKEGKFVSVNCATLGSLADSQLFGHKKGAFTDAQSDHTGYLKEADGGMLFLDEVGELGTETQAKLLKAIEEKKFRPLGAETDETSDFQIICGTNRDLRGNVRTGRFRRDLLARINLWTFELPPLKDRPEDIGPCIDNELAELELEELKKGRKTNITFDAAAKEEFLRFAESAEASWSGNFRDLKNAILRMVTLSDNNSIGKSEVRQEIARLRREWKEEGPEKENAPMGNDSTTSKHENTGATSVDDFLKKFLDAKVLTGLDYIEKVKLTEVIKVCREARSAAAASRKLYNISLGKNRSKNNSDRLSKYLKKHGLHFEQIASAA